MPQGFELFHLSRAEHREVPLFTLRDAAGNEAGTRKAWQRRDMLLALLHGAECPACTRMQRLLEARRGALEEQDITLIPLSAGGAGGDGLLRDEGGEVRQALARALGEPPGAARLVVATRFLRLAAAYDVHSADAEALLAEALEGMRLAQVQCEECSQPLEWE